MLHKRHQKILVEMLSLPTAPFAEDHVRRYVFDFCKSTGMSPGHGRPAAGAPGGPCHQAEDTVGNILVHYKHPAAKVRRPVCFCAHMDHPGFRAVKMLGVSTLRAEWHGGVMPEYFPRAKVRFFSDGGWVRGRVVKTRLKTLGLERPQPMVETVEVALLGTNGQAVKAGSPGMWDFPDPRIRGSHIFARGCDDVAGVAGILCCIDTLVRMKAKTEAYFLLTRAEEVGFIGAIAACRYKTIPKKCLVVAIETSSVIPGVMMGGGPILRVGDKSSIFSPDLTAWCGRVADALAKRERLFTYQRKLMDGGSCESSAYCQLGYDATGVCIALGNYHNCDRSRKKLAPEFVDLSDLANLIKWFVALATTKEELTLGDPRLRKRLMQLENRYHRLLRATV